jgi:hypothetical protein
LYERRERSFFRPCEAGFARSGSDKSIEDAADARSAAGLWLDLAKSVNREVKSIHSKKKQQSRFVLVQEAGLLSFSYL